MPPASVPLEIVPFDAQSATRAQWQAWHVFRRAQAAELRPDDPLLSDAEAEIEEKKHNPLWDHRWWVAWSAGQIIGSCGFGFRRPETERADEFAPYLGGGVGVIATSRRQRIGSALLNQARILMHEMGKTTLNLSSHTASGHAFITHAGGTAKHRTVENRAQMAGLDWPQLRQWEDGVTQHGLVWERHAPRLDMAFIESLLPDFTRLIGDIPLGDLEQPPIRYEMQGYRQWYETMDRVGGAHHLVVLRAPDGSVAGLSELGWDPRTPDRVWQQLTATDRAWRGRGVARALKAAMLRQVHEHHPNVVVMITNNAEVNAPMLSINARVGFKVHRRHVDYQVSRDALDEWVCSRGSVAWPGPCK
jgi:GNAT superfamily N-acetyltransferase